MPSLIQSDLCRLITLVAAVIVSSPAVSAAGPDAEDARLQRARTQIPEVTDRYTDLADALRADLTLADGATDRARIVADSATALWQRAIADVQGGRPDDRPLYWARLALREALIQHVEPGEQAELLTILEHRSRGLADVRFPDGARWRVLITGFDPFHLDQVIAQSNPSGVAALSLDGVTLESAGRSARVETAVIPVRFDAFDNGLIEDFLSEHYRNDDLSLLVTISMGRDQFDLERFPGRRRSAESPDNANVLTGASEDNPLVPLLNGQPLAGPEFVEFSLPAAEMQRTPGQWVIRDNRAVETLESGALEAPNLARIVAETAVRGSGGGYLSNEIAYRSLLLRDTLGLTFAVGHIHTPSLQGYHAVEEARMVAQIRGMLERALSVL